MASVEQSDLVTAVYLTANPLWIDRSFRQPLGLIIVPAIEKSAKLRNSVETTYMKSTVP